MLSLTNARSIKPVKDFVNENEMRRMSIKHKTQLRDIPKDTFQLPGRLQLNQALMGGRILMIWR